MQEKSRGILLIAFGEDYDKLAAHTAFYSRKYTNLPICVVTNLEKRHPKWTEIPGIQFVYVNLETDRNREIKTSLDTYTPFDQTLYMDCDSLIHKSGIEKVFDLLEENDILLFPLMRWEKGNKVLNIYKRMMQQIGCSLPITIYHGAFQLFSKNEMVHYLYLLWQCYWKISGSGRDMPALACAVSNFKDLKVKTFNSKDNVYAGESFNEDAIIQHKYPGDFRRRFNLPDWKSNKPFDNKSYYEDFTWMDFDE